ncbi:YbhB/YbcL family Raf kinase inhibitor-like protein [Rhizobium glycinendophyticum]|uniref:YbhB/YbcL family Raf kinase inhibitor-like protein n=1 Tax=Rhizobium glycinendophyticum TaxID=2589807 RepID=A0A504UZT5_9HYPH|nr:YbhB/YbcL family Raf kinase inhibitor-like protein [Rhizobium glycinendophyticum]TPP10603.1 YbhB/YbcL family Raf kinase inhibitor-like protein [Rhizobium glycinendophyticum]
MARQTFTAALLTLAILATQAQAAEFTLSSPDLRDGGKLPEAQVANSFGCSGQNISPALSWTNAPEGTKSFAVSLYDPDAPTGSGFWHWVLFNIPADVTALQGGISPEAGAPAGSIQSRADAGYAGFLGACPPEGQTHTYVFTVTALDTAKLDLDSTASGALIGFMTNAHALAKASISLRYGR